MMPRDQITIFTDHIREHAHQYFADFDSPRIEVQFDKKQERPASTLYWFTVDDHVKSRAILVKVPLNRGRSASKTVEGWFYKPRLFPKTELKDMYKLEYRALSAIHEYFSNLDDKHLGTIRALDFLPKHHAILVEASRDPSLRQLFLETNRLLSTFKSRDLTLPFQNTGRWLSLYHQISKDNNAKPRHAYRYDFVEAVTTLIDYLAEVTGDKPFFHRIVSVFEAYALQVLPELLPLGLGHGDFTMRNVLVGENSRVTVIDTYAKWRTPIYEDIGYFLNGLKISAHQVISQGLAFRSDQLAAYEYSFLKGYFEQKPFPYPAIRLFEFVSLMDKWASILMYYHKRGAKLKTFGKLKVVLASRYFKNSAESLLKQIDKADLICNPI